MDVREGCCTWNLNLGWGAEWMACEVHIEGTLAV